MVTPSKVVKDYEGFVRDFNSVEKVKKHISKVLTGVFPVETFGDSMTIRFFLWEPHNYRLKIPFSELLRSDSTLKKTICGNVGTMGLFPVKTSVKNITSIRVSDRVVVQVCKTCVVIIWEGSEWFRVSSRGFEGFVDDKVESIRAECLRGLKSIGIGVYLDFDRAVWIRQENSLKGDEFLDALPKKLVVNDTSFKKVYDDKVEFKDASFVKSYVKNRVLEDFGGYEGRIGALEVRVNRLNPLGFLMDNVRVVDDVLALKDYVVLLSEPEKVVFTDWMFSRLGWED